MLRYVMLRYVMLRYVMLCYIIIMVIRTVILKESQQDKLLLESGNQHQLGKEITYNTIIQSLQL